MMFQTNSDNQNFNTPYAPLGLLFALYKQKQLLAPLKNIKIPMKAVNYSACDKVQQILLSIFAGCDTLSEVNMKLKGDVLLAQAGGWTQFADQSTLSKTLDTLTLMNIEQLRQATVKISVKYGETAHHDWRGFLWLDYDLSGLICGKQAEKGTKGYFSGKKTVLDGN